MSVVEVQVGPQVWLACNIFVNSLGLSFLQRWSIHHMHAPIYLSNKLFRDQLRSLVINKVEKKTFVVVCRILSDWGAQRQVHTIVFVGVGCRVALS